jgi:hypothetical protein
LEAEDVFYATVKYLKLADLGTVHDIKDAGKSHAARQGRGGGRP